MVHKINSAILTRFLFVLDSTKALQTGKVVTYEIRKPDRTVFAAGAMTEVGSTAVYFLSWTPNVVGWWTFKISCASPSMNDMRSYFVESGVEKDIKNLLENATFGLSAIETLVDELETRLTAARAGYLDNLSGGAVALEATLTQIKGAGFSAATDTLEKLRDAITALNDLAQSDILNDATPFAGADIATIKGYVDEIESLLKNATYGLSAIETLVDEIESYVKNATYGLPAIETLVDEVESLLKNANYGLDKLARTGADGDTLKSLSDQLDTIAGYTDNVESMITALENKIKASPSVDSILFKSGGAVCPATKSIWDALGDATVSLNTLNNLLTHGTYGLSAIETLVDEVESMLKDGTYGLAALNTDLDAIITALAGLNDLSAAQVNAEVDTALADINLDHFIQTASTVNDAGATATDFDTALTEASNDHYNNLVIVFTSGNLAGQARRIKDYDGTSKNIIVHTAFTEAPANGDAFVIVTGNYSDLISRTKGLDDIHDDLVTHATALGTHDTDIKALLEHATYGLSALETLVDEVESMLKDGTYGLSAIETLVDGLESDVTTIKAETDQLPNWRFEDKLPTTPTVDAEASAAEQSLTAGSVTPTFPTGATRQRAYVVAMLHVANKSAATHKIGLTLQIQKNGGGYGDVVDLTANPPVSLVNVDGACATFAIVCDVTGTVDTSAVQYDFKWLVDSDNAGAVNYTSNFVLVIIYSM